MAPGVSVTHQPESARLVREIFAAFSAWFEHQHDGSTLSMTRASLDLLDSRDKLARWANPGPGANWCARCIPLASVESFCRNFRATHEQRDELMLARLQELQQASGDTLAPEMVAAQWVACVAELSQDEKAVLDAYRSIARDWPRGLYHDGDEPQLLHGTFEALLKRADHLQLEEDAAEEESPVIREAHQRRTSAAHERELIQQQKLAAQRSELKQRAHISRVLKMLRRS